MGRQTRRYSVKLHHYQCLICLAYDRKGRSAKIEIRNPGARTGFAGPWFFRPAPQKVCVRFLLDNYIGLYYIVN